MKENKVTQKMGKGYAEKAVKEKMNKYRNSEEKTSWHEKMIKGK